jgi:cysteine synthase
VRCSDPKLGAQGYLDLAKQVAAETPNSFLLRQFGNPDNTRAHFEGTGPEIWEGTGGLVDAVVAGAGTGGTLSGIGRYLKQQKRSIQVVCVEPTESRVLQGEPAGQHALFGIGAGIPLPLLEELAPGQPWVPGRRGLIDEFMHASTSQSVRVAQVRPEPSTAILRLRVMCPCGWLSSGCSDCSFSLLLISLNITYSIPY